MDEKHSMPKPARLLRTVRSSFPMLYYGSVVEQDHRLRMIRNSIPHFDDFEEIAKHDRRVAKGNKVDMSHPMVIYLNKLALKAKLLGELDQHLISKRVASLPTSKEQELRSRKTYGKTPGVRSDDYRSIEGLQTMAFLERLKIDPRKRWNKLYDRNSPFEIIQETLSAEISNKIIRLRNGQPIKEPAKRWNVEGHQQYTHVSKVEIYRRCQMKRQNEERCFPSSNTGPSEEVNEVDEVSGVALSHVTMSCRDMICECSKCTIGCSLWNLKYTCDACKSEYYDHRSIDISGSLAEDCMIPIFYVQNDAHGLAKKWSDLDIMVFTRRIRLVLKKQNAIFQRLSILPDPLLDICDSGILEPANYLVGQETDLTRPSTSHA